MSDSDSDDIVKEGPVLVGETTSSLEVQLHGAARERLVRALPGTDMSVLKIGLLARLSGLGWNSWLLDDA